MNEAYAETTSDMPVAALVEHVVRANAVKVRSAELSPNGRFLYYVVTKIADAHPGTSRPNVIESDDAWLQALDNQAKPIGKPRKVPPGGFWHPDNLLLVPPETSDAGTAPEMIALDPASGSRKSLTIRTIHEGESGLPTDVIIKPKDMEDLAYILSGKKSGRTKWSPDGQYYAFITSFRSPEKGKRRLRNWVNGLEAWKAVPLEHMYPDPLVSLHGALLLWDVKSGEVRRLVGAGDAVESFDWSPDGRALIVEARSATDYDVDGKLRTDLIIIGRDGKLIRSFNKPGSDEARPSWSPDGRSIAFLRYADAESHTLQHPTYYPPKISFLNPATGVVDIVEEEADMFAGSRIREMRWAKDSRSLSFHVEWDMRQALIKVDPKQLSLAIKPLPSVLDSPVYDRSHMTTSADGRVLAFVESTPASPGELFVVKLDGQGHFLGKPRRVTQLHGNFALKGMVRINKLSWKSPDGQFTIHGQLLSPASAWEGGEVKKALPAVLSYVGGPTSIPAGFGWHFGEMFAMAAHGYAVLIPNTRGRAGWGYGERFAHAIRDAKSRYGKAYQDARAGVDMLIAEGIIDPARMGVMGHSYGGGLTAYTVTQTARFKAAIDSDGSTVNLLEGTQWPRSTPWEKVLTRDLYGIHNPYDPAERMRLIEESAVMNADKIKTPLLMMYTKDGVGVTGVQVLHGQLQKFGTPSELLFYQMAHGPVGITQNVDYVTRMIEWFDYWILGRPWIYPEREQEYRSTRRHEALSQ